MFFFFCFFFGQNVSTRTGDMYPLHVCCLLQKEMRHLGDGAHGQNSKKNFKYDVVSLTQLLAHAK